MKHATSTNFILIGTFLSSLACAPAAVIPNSTVIPENKKLPSSWVKSLFERGTPEVEESRQGLMHIGMPVGGLFCGTVYLGGDGKLWLWDIFNDNREGIVPKVITYDGAGEQQRLRSRDGANYIVPETTQPSLFVRGLPLTRMNAGEKHPLDYSGQDQFQQGFAIKINDRVKTLDINGWPRVRFSGTYPIGTVEYQDPQSPVSVRLEAFSPFIPLNAKDSSLPCTIMSYTITNHSTQSVQGEIGGWIENGVCCNSGHDNPQGGTRINSVHHAHGISMTANSDQKPIASSRKDIIFETFEKDDYQGWTIEGTAFDTSPLDNARIPSYMGDIGMQGSKAAVSHNVRAGGSIEDGDRQKGSLLSREFTIDRNYINFMIAGGNRMKEVGLRLLVDGKVVHQATGHNSNKLRTDNFNVSSLQGKKARLLIEDRAENGWGNIIVDNIILSDIPGKTALPIDQSPDFGSLYICAVPAAGETTKLLTDLPRQSPQKALFSKQPTGQETRAGFHEPAPIGGVTRAFQVQPGQSTTVTFIIAWHFPNIYLNTAGDAGWKDKDGKKGARHYAAYFQNASETGAYVLDNLSRLTQQTRLWRDTWYDSTLPYWFLDRSFANVSTLATTTSHRFANGRFYAWEGVGACGGTCTHVWQYAQAPARLFPEIERYTREYVDLGIGWNPEKGTIAMRGEHHMGPAIDGQCGRIMGMWREHTMTGNNDFLTRIWPRAKQAVQSILDHDYDQDGILDGPQENTLDAAWYGQIAWTSIQALGAWKAGEEMAKVMNDNAFAETCRKRRLTGQQNIQTRLFNGKWFIQIPEADKKNAFGTYNGSFIDQLFGQSMAYQCGLDTILDPKQQKTALMSIWTNNFALDLGPYLEQIKPIGRGYYRQGEGGTLMCTNALNEESPYGGASWTHGYLNECMTGFEHQYASPMMHMGLNQEALAVTKAIHDRHRATKRNPYNEIECSDHYSRAMASYGTFLSACGYQYNGPKGILGFSPKMTPGNFKAAFTTAEGWGIYAQTMKGNQLHARLNLKFGKLQLKQWLLPQLPRQSADAPRVSVSIDSTELPATVNGQTITFNTPLTLEQGQTLNISVQ